MKKTKKPTRQVLQWVGEWTPSRGPTSPPKAKPIMVPFKVVRVWTLFLHTDEKDPPKLPFVPQHNVNAFLEDHVHDWNVLGGTFRYYSRIIDRPVWLLLEVE